MPHTSTKHRVEPRVALAEEVDATESAVLRARRRIRERYYDRPEVRRTLATLILRRAAQGVLGR